MPHNTHRPIDMNTNPFCEVLEPYTLVKVYGNAAKKENSMAKPRALYMPKINTLAPWPSWRLVEPKW